MGRADIATGGRGTLNKRNGPKRVRQARKAGIRRFFTWRRLIAYTLSMCLLLIAAFTALYVWVDVPSANAQAKAQSNIYTYRDGTIMARTGEVNRESVPLSRIPKQVQHTFVAAENKNFYRDPGVSLTGTARGIANTLLGKGKQGGSTITQQYVKNYYLSQEQTVSRKLKELVIALKVDQRMSKDKILEGYLNTSYYGRGAYGIQAAARAYYGVSVEQLTVAQGAYLAALLQAPSSYDWAAAGPNGKRLVTARWNYVLDNMVEKHWLDAETRAGLTFPKPIRPRALPGMDGQTGYLVEAAKAELRRSGVTDQELAAGGWTIRLNIDRKKQHALERSVDQQLNRKLSPSARTVDQHVQAGAASVDPKTGAVVALYGGRGFTEHYNNNALRRDYQPASTFKPLILASALDHGATTRQGTPIGADTVYDGTSRRPVVGGQVPFAPPNEDDRDYGPITVQQAMNHSVNSVFAQMAVDVGLSEVKQTAIDLGMAKDAGGFGEGPAMSLGVMGASPLDMAGVYATLDHHGKKVTPRLVASAQHGDEQTDLPKAVGDQVISRTAADSVTSVLTGVVDDGTGQAVRRTGQAVAGKTGTSDDDKSAWFVGYTPKLVTAVGLFGEGEHGKQVTLRGAAGGGRVNGGGFPAQIWGAYMDRALSGTPASAFDLATGQDTAVPPPATTPPARTPDTGTPTPTPSRTKPTPTPSEPTPSEPTPTPTPTLPTPSGWPTLPTELPTAPAPSDQQGQSGRFGQ
ncbi:penicillin-binding protein [Streptomyces albus subsp. albus]|nr:penicillin-binding protein [Streptomyces albus subsp. albus]